MRQGVFTCLPLLIFVALMTGCVQQTARTATALQPINVPLMEDPKPIAFKKVVVKVPRHQPIGSIGMGLFCVNHGQITPRGGRYSLDTEIFNEVFRDELEAANYEVVGDPDALFEDNSINKADFFIAALIKDIQANVCYPSGGFGNFSDATASVYVNVEWQLYSTLDRTVVLKEQTEGSYKVETPTANGLDVSLESAFGMAAQNLLASKQFHALLVGSAPPTDTVSGPELKVQLRWAEDSDQKFDAVTLRPAVVTVRSAQGHGSGFLISPDGYVLTNYHVVAGASNVRLVLYSGREVPAEVLRYDSRRDVAVLKTGEKGFAALSLSKEPPNIGAEVYAYGTPLSEELSGTLTRGIVSAHRVEKGLSFIQSDVVVQPGNSGGPLLDEQGAVVAITVKGVQLPAGIPSGHNYFIPIADALRALNISEVEKQQTSMK